MPPTKWEWVDSDRVNGASSGTSTHRLRVPGGFLYHLSAWGEDFDNNQLAFVPNDAEQDAIWSAEIRAEERERIAKFVENFGATVDGAADLEDLAAAIREGAK